MTGSAARSGPDLELRVEEIVTAFRREHQHPANLALHALGYSLAAKGVLRLARGRIVSSALHIGIGTGAAIAGHLIEGNEPFTFTREVLGDRSSAPGERTGA